jgi:hypothetical protein
VLGVDGFIPTGVLADVGLDTEDMDELLDQVRDFDLGEFDAGSVASAYATLARKREQFQQAAAYVAPQVGSDDDL